VTGLDTDRCSLLLLRTALAGVGLGVAATLYFLDGLAGYPAATASDGAVALAPILGGVFFLYSFFFQPWRASRLGFILRFIIAAVVVLEVVLGLLPPTARDELTHHLAIPRLYVTAGRILEIPFAPYSYYPMLLDMLYVPWVRWQWDSIPKMVHGLFGLLSGVLIYAYLARRLSPVYGLLGFLFFISTPAIFRLGHVAYVDLGLVFYSTASLLCLLRWLEDPATDNPQSEIPNPKFRWLLLSGLSAGFALATKPNGLLVFFLLFFLLAFSLGSGRRSGLKPFVLGISIFSLFAFLPVCPWLIKNWVQTGNPFFPLLQGFFSQGGGGGAGGVAIVGEGGLGIWATRTLLYGESWWEIAALPLRVFFSGRDDNPQYFDGVLNPILILFLPWAFKGKWIEEKRLLFGFAFFFLVYAVFLTNLRIRYILPIVPPLAILLAFGLHNVYLRIARPPLLFVGVILLAFFNVFYLWNYFVHASPLDYLKGRESREAYITRQLPEYPVFRYINGQLPESAKIYLLFIGRRAYYCERDYFHDGSENPWTLLRILHESVDDAGVLARLRQMGISHLMVREDLMLRFLKDNLDPQRWKKWNAFARRSLRGVYHSGGYSLYEIVG
jgi:hypothetical protein